MEELAAAGIASLLHSSSSAATLQAPDLARALFPRAVWLRWEHDSVPRHWPAPDPLLAGAAAGRLPYR